MKEKTKFYIRTCSIEQKGVLITVFINTIFVSLSRVDVTKSVEVYSKNTLFNVFEWIKLIIQQLSVLPYTNTGCEYHKGYSYTSRISSPVNQIYGAS